MPLYRRQSIVLSSDSSNTRVPSLLTERRATCSLPLIEIATSIVCKDEGFAKWIAKGITEGIADSVAEGEVVTVLPVARPEVKVMPGATVWSEVLQATVPLSGAEGAVLNPKGLPEALGPVL